MMVWIQHVKDAFFITGSIAGLLALFRPVLESKFKSDMVRASAILTNLNEGGVMALDHCTYVARHVPDEILRPFDEVGHKLHENRQETRFTGPLRCYLQSELRSLIEAYGAYRKFVQVPCWEPRKYGDGDETAWFFNKDAFRQGNKLSDEYVTHLDSAGEAAFQVQKRFQRFQALTELHFYEALLPKWFVSRKWRALKLDRL